MTNNGLELIEILRDIAEDDEKATTNDRIAATKILNDRAFGKSPRQISPSAGPNPDPTPETDDNDAGTPPVGAIRESPSTNTHGEPDSPRLVTQIDDALNRSLGPAPSAHTDVGAIRESPVSPDPFNPQLNPFHHPTTYSRHHQQRPDPTRHPAGNRQSLS